MPEASGYGLSGERFDWYAWPAPTHVGAEAILRSFALAASARKRLRRLRIIGAALELDCSRLEASGAGQNPGGGLCRDAGAGKAALRGLKVPHAVSLCEPVVFEFEDGSGLAFQPGWPDCARTGWNSIPAACTEGLNRQNVDSDRLFGRYLQGSWLQDMRVETQIVTLTRARLSDPGRCHTSATTIWRYVFVFANHARLVATVDGGGWYGLSLITAEGGGTLPYPLFRAAARPVVQPLLCHGGCGEDAFSVYVRTGGAALAARPEPSFSVDVDVVESCLYAALEQYVMPQACAAEGSAGRFDWYGSNLYSRDATSRLAAALRAQAAALRRGEDTGAFRTLLRLAEGACRPSWLPLPRGGAALSRPDLRASLAGFYDRFCTRLEALIRILPEDGALEFLGL